MKGPATWEELKALVSGRVEELDVLDFKRELDRDNQKTAQLLSAMTVDGGVVLYGVGEDKSSKAAAIHPVELAGIEARLRQIADSRISPPPYFEVRTITENPDDPMGVVVVTIPPSNIAPHYSGGKFWRRSGATAREMSEPEISNLYRSRRFADRHEKTQPPTSGQVGRFLNSLGRENRYGSVGIPEGVGVLDVVVSLDGDPSHPREPWLEDPLLNAIDSTSTWAKEEEYRATFAHTVASRSSKSVRSVDGISLIGDHPPQKMRSAGVTATFSGALMLRSLFPVRWSFEEDMELDYSCAYESLILDDLACFLRLAGTWFRQYPLTGFGTVGVELGGFNDCVSYSATRGLAIDTSHLDKAPPQYENRLRGSVSQFESEPFEFAKVLIQNWVATFVEDESEFRRIVSR